MVEAIRVYLQANAASYAALILQHLEISGIALLAALLIGFPAGIAAARSPALYQAISGFFGLLRVVPSLAVLILCIPLMGVGAKPSIVALSILAVPPLIINTALGFTTLSPFVLETARGMGMGRSRMFFTVKLPLALPMIFTGLRTAAVEIIASATLAAYIGAGGLGTMIMTGLGLNRMELLLLGGLTVAILSLTADLLFSLLERKATAYQRP